MCVKANRVRSRHADRTFTRTNRTTTDNGPKPSTNSTRCHSAPATGDRESGNNSHRPLLLGSKRRHSDVQC